MQENPLMYNGTPCEDLYPNEHFEKGITNGANWYNVPGMPPVFTLLLLAAHVCFSHGSSNKAV